MTVLILGGYGNFGKRISLSLAKAGISIIIVGRDQSKAESLQAELKSNIPNSQIDFSIFDIKNAFLAHLKKLKPFIVINASGPFQDNDYSIAKACIAEKVHYLDLADGRDFVTGINALNEDAKINNVMIISGASTVPGLSSAVIEHYKNNFSKIDSVDYGISPGAKSPRGLATTQSILTILGRPLKPVVGCDRIRYGWQDLHRVYYPDLGYRWMANCEIPDLDVFPEKYHIKSMRFSAGMESALLHFNMWIVSWIVRCIPSISLREHADFLLRLSKRFDIFGSANGGMHVFIKGFDINNTSKEIKWFIIAKNNDGPQIPCIPIIHLTKKIIAGTFDKPGAYPCVGLITLDEYVNELKGLAMTQHEIVNTIQAPLIEKIYGEQTKDIPKLLQKRYANRPNSNDQLLVKGEMNIVTSKTYRILSPLFRLAGALVPYPALKIPVTVKFVSNDQSNEILMHRTFNYVDRSPYHFQSKVIHIKDNLVIELMRFRLAIKLRYKFDKNKIILDHGGYALYIGKKLIPIPLGLLIGKVYAYEEAYSDDQINMLVRLTHPLFGKLFQYDGYFKIEEMETK